jgi:protein TilB
MNNRIVFLRSLQAKKDDFHNKVTKHTPEARLEAARNLSEFRDVKRNHLERKAKEPRILFGPDGRRLQKNEGKWEFKWVETKQTLTLNVEISKFLDTSFIDVDVNPGWISITIKDKLLVLTFDCSVNPDRTICERSKVSGLLAITMLKSEVEGDVEIIRAKERSDAEVERERASESKKKLDAERKTRGRRYEGLREPTGVVDYKNNVNSGNKQADGKKTNYKFVSINNIAINSNLHDKVVDENFVDDPSVPPLC